VSCRSLTHFGFPAAEISRYSCCIACWAVARSLSRTLRRWFSSSLLVSFFDQSAILATNRGQLVVNDIESFLPLLIVSDLRHTIRRGVFSFAWQKIVIFLLLQQSHNLLAFGESPLRGEQVD
jgi:hypothetical protein